jgi:hypothetical protein
MISVCPSCRNELEIPEELADSPVRCGLCGHVFTPRPSDRASEPAEPRFDSKVRAQHRQSGPASASNSAVWFLAFVTAIIFGAISSFCVWGVLLVAYPRFEAITDAAGGFRAVFPGEPTAVCRTWADDQLVFGQEFTREIPDERYFVYYTDWPANLQHLPTEDRFDIVIEWLLDQYPGIEEREQDRMTHDGYPARDLLADGVEFQTLVVRMIQVNDRVYVVGISGPISPVDARVREFFRGFHIHKP